MHDAAFKTVFCHPAAIERLVRRYAPERVGDIDFSTLRKLDAQLVGEALVRRYPDMLWIASTTAGDRRVVVQLEFQGKREPLMALRMAVYQMLTVQQLLRRTPSLRPSRSLDVLSFVIHHGGGRARASASLRRLFPSWVPGDYRLISRSPGGSKGDLAQTILQLEQDRSVDATLEVVGELTLIADETGSDYDRLMAECVAEMLVSTKRITREQLGEVRTMAEVATTYQRSLEEYGRRRYRRGRDEGIRQGRDEGIRQGQAAILVQLAREKFGSHAAEQLSPVVHQDPDPARLSAVASALLASVTADEFAARIRTLSPERLSS